MFRRIDTLIGGGLLAGVLLVAGCTSTGGTTTQSQQTHSAMQGMMCPKCETVWLYDRAAQPPRYVTTLTQSQVMMCPDCDAMAKSQLLGDGKVMLHECPTCKVTPVAVEPHEHPDTNAPRP